MTTTINTVLGEVATDELGITDYHEHLYVQPPQWLAAIDADFALNDERRSAEELARWSQAGGKTLVEMSAPDFGRDVEAVRRINEHVPEVHVIQTSGFNRPYYMGRWVHWLDETDAVRRVVAELTVGIDGTGVRAGVIKAGTEYNSFDEPGRKLLRIAAAAHTETGAPIMTHTTAGTMGLEQVEFLEEHGVPAHRICVGHMDRNPDLAVHAAVARAGAYLGYDCAGKIKHGSEEPRIRTLQGMIDGGYGHHLLIGNDLGRPSYWVSYGGGPGLDFLLTRHVPRLQASGVSRAWIDNLLIDNPARFFSGEPPSESAVTASSGPDAR